MGNMCEHCGFRWSIDGGTWCQECAAQGFEDFSAWCSSLPETLAETREAIKELQEAVIEAERKGRPSVAKTMRDAVELYRTHALQLAAEGERV